MATPTCRLLPYEVADGATNMSADEVLLEAAAATGLASLRFYGWHPATLSLGYFQPAAARLQDRRLAALPWVRRPSGGGALVHDAELTYALALPASTPWQARGRSWLTRMHEILAAALREVGVPVELGVEEKGRGEFLCFLHQTPGDVLLHGRKIIGSAQRKLRGAILQHGSILLGASAHAPALVGIADLLGRSVPVDIASLSKAINRQLGCRLEPTPWSDEELERTATKSRARYASPAWNDMR